MVCRKESIYDIFLYDDHRDTVVLFNGGGGGGGVVVLPVKKSMRGSLEI